MSSHALSLRRAPALAAACRRAADGLRVTARTLAHAPGTEVAAAHAARAAAWLDEEAHDIERRVRVLTGDGRASGAHAAAALASTWRGTPYVWGGSRPGRGLDCSGLVQAAYLRVGVRLPRTSRAQARSGVAVRSLRDARPGDLLCFGRPVHHVALYVGGGRMVEAPRRGLAVRTVAVRPPTSIRRVL
jgi:cell wall-associated NlpC family hydrolase